MRIQIALSLFVVLMLGAIALGASPAQEAGAAAQSPLAQTVAIKPGVPYQVLIGPPQTVKTRSGHVVLAPGKSVGRHSTEDNEEVLVIFEGTGEFTVEGGPTLKMSPDVILYCPPGKFHNVTNTGTGPLRYVFVVGKAK